MKKAAGCFALLAVVVWLPPVWGGQALFYDTLFRYCYPYQMFIRETISAGRFPFWNPYIYSGLPFMANLQSGLFYPSTYLYFLSDYSTALWFETVLHTFLGACFMFGYARARGLSQQGSLLAGLIFAFNGFFINHYAYTSQLRAYIWLPLILWSARRAWERPLPDIGWAAGALALQIFAGQPQFVFYSLLALAVDFPWRQWQTPALVVGGMLGLAGLWTLFQTFPTFLIALNSPRTLANSFEWATSLSLKPNELLLMLVGPWWNRWFTPTTGDPHILAFYIGLPALALALLGLFRRPARFKSMGLRCGALAFGALLLTLGGYLPLYGILMKIILPLQYLRFPAQASYLACFGLALLAALGLDSLKFKKATVLAVLGVIAFDLWLFSTKAIVTIDRQFYQASSTTALLVGPQQNDGRVLLTPRSRAAAMNQKGDNALQASLGFHEALLPNIGMVHKVLDADGYEELRNARYDQILNEIVTNPLSPFMNALGIRYVLSYWENLPPPFVLKARTSLNIYENPRALPRFYGVANAVSLPSAEVLPAVSSGKIDFQSTVVLDSDQAADSSSAPSRGTFNVELAGYEPGHIRVKTDADTEGWLVVAESYDPGWRATVNGRPSRLYRANLVQMAVPLPRWDSVIELDYRPPLFWLSVVISAGTFLLFWIMMWLRRKRETKN